jgi:DNA repair photolyase
MANRHRQDGTVAATHRGRGATCNPAPRYLATVREAVADGWADDGAPTPLPTTVTGERARSIISTNDSPDVPFAASINPYRGCEHGCVYCYARPSHAYLDLSPGLDFETRLYAKVNAAELLRRELRRPGYRCLPIALGANTDPYQPIEHRWLVTRQVIEVLTECNHPLTIVTKSARVERDLDLLEPMARRNLVRVYISVTTLDQQLARRLEPRASAPQRRIAAVANLRAAGVPVGVLFAPVIPALNDHEMERVLETAAAAGAGQAGYVLLRLPHEVKDMFTAWLAANYPLKANHVMNIVRDLRGGRENDPRFGVRMRGSGNYAELIARRFAIACRRLGLAGGGSPLDTARFRPPAGPGDQRDLFAE